MKHLSLVFLALIMTACGQDGYNGMNGQNGKNGHSVVFMQGIATHELCANSGTVIMMGLDLNDDYVLENYEMQSAAVICNGTNGQNGADGINGTNGHDGLDASMSPFTPIDLVNPCGDAPNRYDEVFIRLQNGTLLASFSDSVNGQNTRFSVLTQGSYMTTDGDSCRFSIDAYGQVTNENHHY